MFIGLFSCHENKQKSGAGTMGCLPHVRFHGSKRSLGTAAGKNLKRSALGGFPAAIPPPVHPPPISPLKN